MSARMLSLTDFGYSRPDKATRPAAISGWRTRPKPGLGDERNSSPIVDIDALEAAEWRPVEAEEMGRKADGLGRDARRIPGGGSGVRGGRGADVGGAVADLELGREGGEETGREREVDRGLLSAEEEREV